jgi:hypothetical protein
MQTSAIPLLYADFIQSTPQTNLHGLISQILFPASLLLVWDVESSGAERQPHKTITIAYCCEYYRQTGKQSMPS